MYDLIAERKPTRNGFHKNNFGIFKMHTLKSPLPKKMKKTSANQEHPNAGSRLNQGLKESNLYDKK